ncbi:hypothetical protein [Cellulomonas phragmiteti]|nr:hypothetical protein [Cellulomonas phragmiteti]
MLVEINSARAREASETGMRIQESIAACMKTQGFEYVPVDPDAVPRWQNVEAVQAVGTRDYAEKYGYGLAESVLNPGVLLNDDWIDENAGIFNTLSDEARLSYLATLEGKAADPVPVGEPADVLGWAERGCRGAAENDVLNAASSTDDASLQAAQDAAALAAERAATDPATSDATLQWAQCLEDAGYSGYESVADPRSDLANQMFAIVQFPNEGSNEPPKVRDREALRKFADREIELAVADYECQQSSGYERAFRAARVKYEKEYIAAHEDELQELMSSIE